MQVPHIFWVKRASGSGINLPAVLEGAAKLTIVQSKPEIRIKLTEELGHVLHAYFRRNITGL